MSSTLGGKLDVANQRLTEHAQDKNMIIGTIILAALAVIAAFIGLITYGDALFGRGMNVQDVIKSVIKETQEQQRNNTAVPTPVPGQQRR